MRGPLISVIIPVYNTAAYNERCIRSVQDNDYRNLEIICVNDGSTDNSLAMLRGFASDDPRIRIIDKPNGGLSSARNAGLDAATGEYIAFIDSDDWVHRSYFSVLAKEAVNSGAEITVADYIEVFGDDTSGKDLPLSQEIAVTCMAGKEAMSRHGSVRAKVWGRLYKKAYIGDKRFPVGINLGEDTIFNVMTAKADHFRVVVVDVPVYFYYQSRSDSLVHIRARDAHYTLGSWYIDNLAMFELKDVAIFSAYSALLPYRLECSRSAQTRDMQKKTQAKLNECLKELIRLRGCSMLRKLRYIVFTVFPFAYELVLRIKYPSDFKRM